MQPAGPAYAQSAEAAHCLLYTDSGQPVYRTAAAAAAAASSITVKELAMIERSELPICVQINAIDAAVDKLSPTVSPSC